MYGRLNLGGGHFCIRAHLENLIAIVDRKSPRRDGLYRKFHRIRTICGQMEACGWEVSIVNGHDLQQLQEAFKYGQTDATSASSDHCSNNKRQRDFFYRNRSYLAYADVVIQRRNSTCSEGIGKE